MHPDRRSACATSSPARFHRAAIARSNGFRQQLRAECRRSLPARLRMRPRRCDSLPPSRLHARTCRVGVSRAGVSVDRPCLAVSSCRDGLRLACRTAASSRRGACQARERSCTRPECRRCAYPPVCAVPGPLPSVSSRQPLRRLTRAASALPAALRRARYQARAVRSSRYPRLRTPFISGGPCRQIVLVGDHACQQIDHPLVVLDRRHVQQREGLR